MVQLFLFIRTLCGQLRHLDVIIDIPFIRSTGLAIVAEADLLCGIFLSEKSCHKLVVSTSFWSWLLNVSSVLNCLKYTAIFFGSLVCCGFADSSWEYYVFDFGLYVSEICLLCVCS